MQGTQLGKQREGWTLVLHAPHPNVLAEHRCFPQMHCPHSWCIFLKGKCALFKCFSFIPSFQMRENALPFTK